MIKKKTIIKDSYIFKNQSIFDKRGSFTRVFCSDNFKIKDKKIKQINISHNKNKYTLRGFHFQKKPFSEGKFVYVLKGSIQFVIIDLRKKSSSFEKKISIKLTDKNNSTIYVPKGCANAFLTLEKDTKIIYFMTESYNPNFALGINYNDSFFNVKWKKEPRCISQKDKKLPFYKEIKI
tara:strand:- start:1141 stop:1674 length:534 start_codon:yes stop_codon:yes gene_type:complete